MTIPRIEETEASYHYWRECHKCGNAGNHYLHCLHDGIQSNCVNCGEELPSFPQDCDCEFVTTETEHYPQLQEVHQAGYADGYKQGKFDAEVTAEYGEPKALQDNK